MPIVQIPRPFFSLISYIRSLLAPGKPEQATGTPVAGALIRPANFDPQIARRMTQLEAEISRLAESQEADREERVRLAVEMRRLRLARPEPALPHAAEEEFFLEPPKL